MLNRSIYKNRSKFNLFLLLYVAAFLFGCLIGIESSLFIEEDLALKYHFDTVGETVNRHFIKRILCCLGLLLSSLISNYGSMFAFVFFLVNGYAVGCTGLFLISEYGFSWVTWTNCVIYVIQFAAYLFFSLNTSCVLCLSENKYCRSKTEIVNHFILAAVLAVLISGFCTLIERLMMLMSSII